jgi:hypothetical protein
MITATEVPKLERRFSGTIVELRLEILGKLPHNAAAKHPDENLLEPGSV